MQQWPNLWQPNKFVIAAPESEFTSYTASEERGICMSIVRHESYYNVSYGDE